MQLKLLAVGQKMPRWVDDGVAEYAKRMPRDCSFVTQPITLAKRGKNPDIARARAQEGEKILAAAQGCRLVTLDFAGKAWSTEQLAERLQLWREDGRDVALAVGGPDGLDQPVLQQAQDSWSLSNLTFPHPLVRLIVAEQLYRAWTVTQGHPYHSGH